MPFKRPPPKKKAASQAPTTADAFLSQGVQLEESAEKWRAGDATKAARFYAKAIETYSAGLSRFPASFDLQYNAARARFAVTQYAGIAALSPESVEEQLAAALAGHEAAMGMEGGAGNADVLFNTAQVLRSYAEALDEGDERGLEMLERAMGHLGVCLDVQEARLKAREEDEREAARQLAEAHRDGFTTDGEGTANEETETEETEDDEDQKWAFIEEPVTLSTLLDTCVAIAETLAAACEAAAALGIHEKLKQIEQASTSFLQQRSQVYMDAAEPVDRVEACCARAKTKCALLDAAYALDTIDLNAYDAGRAAAFDAELAYIEAGDPEFLCAQAESLVEFASTAAEQEAPVGKRWTRLEKALNLFTAAANANGEPAEQSATHIRRGDTELLRLSITLDPAAPASLHGEPVRRTLVQNAQKFYRAARACVQGDLSGAAQQNSRSAQIKEAVAAAVEAQSAEPIQALQKAGISHESVKATLDEMIAEAILPETLTSRIGCLD